MLEILFTAQSEEPPAPPGQVFFSSTTIDPVEWTVPKGVKEVCIVCVGQGGHGTPTTGSDGGALRWRNAVPVKSGEVLQVYTFDGISPNAPEGESSRVVRKSTGDTLLCAKGGGNTRFPSTPYDWDNGLGGGNGGLDAAAYGGGGAGGYNNNGGNARGQSGDDGMGGGGGAGGLNWTRPDYTGQGGGGVGVHGLGANGTGGKLSQNGYGRGGTSGSLFITGALPDQRPLEYAPSVGGARFGGGGGRSLPSQPFSDSGAGAVRILWGEGRYFPNINVLDK